MPDYFYKSVVHHPGYSILELRRYKINELIQKFHTLEHQFFSMLSFIQNDYNNIIAYATGVQSPSLNPAFVQKIDSTLSKNLISCRSFYKNKSLPWALVLPDYLFDADINRTLENQSFEMVDTGVAMIANTRD